ncbi:hypothetical protein Tco_0646761 [Tanacetum coccineum]
MVAFLEKSTGSAGFHQVINFLNRSHICYALTKKPDVYISYITQFWRSAEVTTDDNREVQLTATIDGHSMTITEASLRRHLKLDDHDGITSIPNSEIFEQLALMGYHTDSDKLTFQKGAFSPQWRFLIHTILHCLSPKKTAWEQFSSNIATAVICLATNRKFNFSRKQLQQHSRTYPVPSLSIKVFNNMKRPTKEQHFPTPYDSPLHDVHSHGSDEGSMKLNELTTLVTKLSERIRVLEEDLKKTKLTYSATVTKIILRVNKLKAQVKVGKARKRAQVVLSKDDEDVEDDSSKQRRKLSDAEVQEKASTKTEPIIQKVTPTEVIQDQGSSEKGNSEVSTVGATKGTASEVPVVSTAEENISTAGRTSQEKSLERGFEQERLSFAEAIRLQEQMDEEQRAQITRDEEIARQWNKEEEQRAMSKAKSSKKIDWNDPSVIRYHTQKMKPKTVTQARRNMVKYLKNQGNYKISDFKGMSYNEIRPIFEKMELDDEKEDLKGYLDIVPREDVTEDVESLSAKGDGSSKNYKVLSEMLEDFDRQDVMDLYRLVKERYSTSRPEGYDLML